MTAPNSHAPLPGGRRAWDVAFFAVLGALGGSYILLIGLLLVADAARTSPAHFLAALARKELQYSAWLTLVTCTLSAIFSVWVAVPLGYLLSRFDSGGRAWLVGLRWLVDTLLDIPIVLPPLVIGLSLLILFHWPLFGSGNTLESVLQNWLGRGITFEKPSIVLAQFAVAGAFAVRTMRITFDGINPRTELVALTLGCTRAQAFWRVVLPQAWRGVVTAFTVAWARALGEFGPILVFSGATRMKTEVLSTSVFLELSVGELESAVAVSLVMVVAAVAVLLVVRVVGLESRRM